MKHLIVLLALVGMVGCRGSSTVASLWKPSPPSPPQDYIVEWKRAAKVHKLYWSIECTYEITGGTAGGEDQPDQHYFGAFWKLPGPHDRTDQELWFAGGSTQQEVAKKLLAAIDAPPSSTPSTSTKVKPPKQCDPPLYGKPEDRP